MKQFEVKSIDNSVKDVSTETRKVKVAISHTGSKDLDNDVIDKSAYNRTIAHRGPKGQNLIWHLTDHRASMKDAVGKPSEIYMESDYLVFVTDIPKTTWGNDVMEFYKSGIINSHSVGFRTIKSEPVNAGKPDEYRLLKELFLYEGSSVLWPANENTPTLSVGKSLTKEETETEFFATTKEFNNLAKLFKDGHLSDQSFELVEIRMAYLSDKLQELFKKATHPAANAHDSVEGDLLKAIQTFNNSLILQHHGRTAQSCTG